MKVQKYNKKKDASNVSHVCDFHHLQNTMKAENPQGGTNTDCIVHLCSWGSAGLLKLNACRTTARPQKNELVNSKDWTSGHVWTAVVNVEAVDIWTWGTSVPTLVLVHRSSSTVLHLKTWRLWVWRMWGWTWRWGVKKQRMRSTQWAFTLSMGVYINRFNTLNTKSSKIIINIAVIKNIQYMHIYSVLWGGGVFWIVPLFPP